MYENEGALWGSCSPQGGDAAVTSRVGRNCVIFLASHKCYRKGVREMGTEKQGYWGRVRERREGHRCAPCDKGSKRLCGGQTRGDQHRGVRSFSWKALKMAWTVEEPGMLVGFWCEQLCQWLLYWDRETKREDGIILEMVSSILENFSLCILRSKAR